MFLMYCMQINMISNWANEMQQVTLIPERDVRD
jgi:hypothetical protein